MCIYTEISIVFKLKITHDLNLSNLTIALKTVKITKTRKISDNI